MTLFKVGLVWALPSASPRARLAWAVHGYQRQLNPIRWRAAPRLAVVGSSVVGPVNPRVLEAILPGWACATGAATSAKMEDWDFLTRTAIQARADAIVFALVWCAAQPVPEDISWDTARYGARLPPGPGLWTYRHNVWGAAALLWREPVRPYQSRHTWSVVEEWDIPSDEYADVEWPAIMAGATDQFRALRHWASTDYPVKRFIVILPMNPAYEAAGVVPTQIGSILAQQVHAATLHIPLLDLTGTESADAFRDAYHLQGDNYQTSVAIGMWLSTKLPPP